MTPAPVWSKAVPLLVLAGVLSYANSLTKAFVFDDNWAIVRNPYLGRLDWETLRSNRPVITATLFLNYKLGGLNPVGYRAVNVAVHVLAALTAYGLIRRTLLLPRFAGRYDATAGRLAFAAALVWLVHPLNTQAVTYVIQRCESLMGLFYLLAVYAWVRGATAAGRGGWAWFAAAAVSFALSGKCKEVAATLPAVVLTYDRVFLARSWGDLIRRRWAAYLVFGAVAAWVASGVVVASLAAGTAESGAGFALENLAPTSAQEVASPKTYLFTQAGVIVRYLRLAVWPTGLTLDYFGWPVAKSLADVGPAAAVVVALLTATLLLLYFRPAAGFLGAWFFLILAPTSSVMPIVDVAFEHRMYLPLLAVVTAAVLGGSAAVRWAADRAGRPDLGPAAGMVLLVLTAGVLTRLTAARNEDYRSALTIWADTAAKRPDSVRARMTVAELYTRNGQLREARPMLEALQRDAPTNPFVQLNLGRWLENAGRYRDAIPVFRACARPEAKLGTLAHMRLGRVLLADDQAAAAADVFRAATTIRPDDAEAWGWLAACELAAGRADKAEAAWAKGSSTGPGFLSAARAAVLAETANDTDLRVALPLARAGCHWTANPPALDLDTLALCQAAAGDLKTAAATAARAAAAAGVAGQPTQAAAMRDRAVRYASGKSDVRPIPAKPSSKVEG